MARRRVCVDTLERAMFALAFAATSRALPTRRAIEARPRARASTARARTTARVGRPWGDVGDRRHDRVTDDARALSIPQRRSRRAPTTRALFGKKPASEPAPAAGKSRFNKPAKATEKPAKGEPYLVDGKLWVCQGCGYVYDGQRGAWAEGKRCPMCGERRFALKDPQELQVAIYSLVALVGLLGVLYGLVTLF